VLRGAFRLREPGPTNDRVIIASCGTMVPEALAAAETLASDEGVAATVLCLSSPDRLYRDWRKTQLTPILDGKIASERSHLERLISGDERGTPVVTVIDGASHALAWIGSALGVKCIPLGVDDFGQAGSQPALYDAYCVSADAIVVAALSALEP
jgi:pyruvate dehydrogenase E1 component